MIEQTQVATPYFLYESCTINLLRFARPQGVHTLPPLKSWILTARYSIEKKKVATWV